MGISSNKTKTKSTTSATPLDQYSPYINQGLATAQGVLDGNQGNLGQMSQSAYGLYNDLAKSIGTGSGFVSNAQNIAANIYGGGYIGGNPGATTYQNLQGAADPSLGVLSHLAQGATSPGNYGGIGGDNPALDMLSGMTNQTANPDSAQFYKDTMAGKYLNGNPYLDAMVAQSGGAATKAVNQRFAAAGMGDGLSTPYASLLSRNLADSENNLRYTAYNNELGRMGSIGGQSDGQYNATQDRSLAAATGLGSLYNQTGQLKLSAQQAQDAAFASDRNSQLAAAQALGSQGTADAATKLNAATAADTQYGNQISQLLQALGLAPQLSEAQSNAQYAGVSPALQALSSAATTPYAGASNYAALVNGLTGKYGNEATTGTTTTGGLANVLNSISGVMNGASGAINSFKGLKLSDVRAKRDILPIGMLDDGLGVYAYRYHWSDDPQIGVMAQDVAALRPWALGPVTDGYLTVDYSAL